MCLVAGGWRRLGDTCRPCTVLWVYQSLRSGQPGRKFGTDVRRVPGLQRDRQVRSAHHLATCTQQGPLCPRVLRPTTTSHLCPFPIHIQHHSHTLATTPLIPTHHIISSHLPSPNTLPSPCCNPVVCAHSGKDSQLRNALQPNYSVALTRVGPVRCADRSTPVSRPCLAGCFLTTELQSSSEISSRAPATCKVAQPGG